MAVFFWALYDFANQPFTTLVVTFVYGTFFTKVIAENEIIGTLLWSRGITITALIVAILSPIMGAIADNGGYKKIYLIFWTWISIIGTILLWYPMETQVGFALTAFIIANIGFEMGGVFCNAFILDVASRDNIGRISGYGWSFGYAGGLISLAIGLVLFINPDPSYFNLDKNIHEHIRATNIMVAVWFAVFSIPTFLYVKENKRPVIESSKLMSNSFKSLIVTFQSIRHYSDLSKFLIARLIYNDGLITIFAFGGIYASGTFNFTMSEIMIFAIVLNVSAGIGAFSMGFLDDIIGGKKTIQISNYGLIIACIIAIVAPNKDLFVINFLIVKDVTVSGKVLFWCAGILIGIFSGPNQASSRSLMARFIPKGKESEFFGFFAFSGKATAFLGPFLLGMITSIFNSQRYGIAVVLLLLIIGSILLSRVDERSGIDTAKQAM